MTLGLRDIGAEAIVLAGGGRAILLQLAHPAVGRGVAEHSDFIERPYDRLRGTLTYLYAIASDDPEDAADVRRIVNRAHAVVRGEADEGAEAAEAPAYNAYDPELQLWVTATLYESARQIYELVCGPMDAESADRVYREFVVIGTSLQMPEHLWPADRAAFDEYWRNAIATLHVTADARRVARDLLEGSRVPMLLRAAMPLARLATVALLPACLREPFGLRLTERNRRRFQRWMAATRAVYSILPARVRHAPRDRSLRALRARRAARL